MTTRYIAVCTYVDMAPHDATVLIGSAYSLDGIYKIVDEARKESNYYFNFDDYDIYERLDRADLVFDAAGLGNL